MKTWKTLAAAMVALSLLTAACGSSSAATGGGPSGAPTSTSSGGSGGGVSVLTLSQANFSFSPGKISVKAGDAITVADTDPSTPHTFTIDGTSIDITNDGGTSQDVTIDLTPGTYEFYCRFHKSLGMKGTLVVK
ncbi:MAG: cupredoxin domain-containing protein [Actinobacteria bacterium]|nr:cupredoxin domain-containing protein [Actinomycetota bacterium]